MKPEFNNIVLQPVSMTLLTDTAYIDQTKVNGEIYTFLMEKKKEPNIFSATKYEKGDHVDQYAVDFRSKEND